jgi:type II secretory pathway pseudopilin PulG
MNLNLIVLLLQQRHFSHKNYEQGSILIKLLFAIFTLGLISAVMMISLPSLLSCNNKSRQAEAKNNIRVMNRAQQAYFLEHNTFAQSFKELQIGIKEQTENYKYSMTVGKNATFNYAISYAGRSTIAQHKNTFTLNRPYLKNYVSAVFVTPDPQDNKTLLTFVIACETNSPSNTYPPQPTFKNGVPNCGVGTKDISK